MQGKHLIAGGLAAALTMLALDYGGFGPSETALVALALWWTVALGLALGLFPRSWTPRVAVVAGVLLILLTALSGTSIAWASDRGLALAETVQMSMLAGVFLLVVFLSRRGDGRAWLTGLAFGLFSIVLLGLVSRFFPGLGDDRELTATLGEMAGGRLSWPLGYWNAIGAIAAVYAVLAVFVGGSASSRLWRSIATASLPAVLTVFYLCSSRGALVAGVAGIVLLVALGPARTQKLGSLLIGFLGGVAPVFIASRSIDLVNAQPTAQADEQGLVLLGVTCVASALTFALRYLIDGQLSRISIPRSLGWGMTGVAVTALIVGVALADPAQRFENFTELPTENPTISRSNAYATEHLLGLGGNGRWQLWASAIRAAEAEPLGGTGAGGYAAWFKQDGDIWLKTVDAHSTPLQILAELGVPGFLLFVAFGVIVIGAGVVRLRRGPLAERIGKSLPEGREGGSGPNWTELPVWLSLLLVGLIAISIDWSFEYPVMSIPLLIAAAMLSGPAYRVEPVPQKEGPRISILFTAVVLPLAAIVIVLAWNQYNAVTSIEASQEAVRSGNAQRALSESLKAIDATPSSGATYSQAAAVLLSADQPRQALPYAVKATREAPLNTSFWIQRSLIEARLNLSEAALRSITRAEETDPGAPIWEDG